MSFDINTFNLDISDAEQYINQVISSPSFANDFSNFKTLTSPAVQRAWSPTLSQTSSSQCSMTSLESTDQEMYFMDTGPSSVSGSDQEGDSSPIRRSPKTTKGKRGRPKKPVDELRNKINADRSAEYRKKQNEKRDKADIEKDRIKKEYEEFYEKYLAMKQLVDQAELSLNIALRNNLPRALEN